ncbi:hypothetical protein [Singulisphaera acidiphila]|uniref:WD40 repeat-containing protein n=1 Tax=Singulisphaera acidiphila (strain ATCC BAA-1392 / DSM 18658 / VKM B-2454 / MOB10) TaxID=886293 RepID=L0DNI0_SINAD|nr:hypothetical protein [Singulisphaera acidiphila]AGA30388.1 WD40 repeat-containing protein [Singulisphaera acidiphila DSM 18658]
MYRHCWIRGGALFLISAVWVVRAEAQANLGDITQPIPVVNSGGHSAPVRSLIFTAADGSTLLSGGMDKVVNVWNLGDPRPRLVQTIRPRIWRGYAGSIYAMALSPMADARGQKLLAIAGIGVDSNRAEINLFRFPGLQQGTTGEVDSQLPSGPPRGHGMSVMCLAFDPTGQFLASGSNDATVRIWGLQTRTTTSVLTGHRGPVNALAYAPSGRRLVTGGADGLLNLWDVDRGVIIATARPNPARQNLKDPAGDAINALVVSPKGTWVVIGRENGDLIRYDLANLANETLLPRGENGQGAVEALAVSHDGNRLVSSVLSHRLARPSDLPSVECDVELRSMPQGAVLSRLARASNLVYACTFSPDDKRLAFAGGDTQGITIRDLADPNGAPIELAGQGSSLWDIGFGPDGRTVGFARSRPDLPGPAPKYEDFDLRGQRVTMFDRGELSRSVPTLDGWKVQPIDPYTLDLLNAQGQGYRLKLDPNIDRRWWSYSFIPKSPTHPLPMLAVGSEVGVIFFRLQDGARTRIYAGHSGPVYTLAPSPDGVWLATGSADQTVRFWRLAGCDTLPPLGARFNKADGGQVSVAAVEPKSFAEAMDLHVGDEVQKFYVGGKEASDVGQLDSVLPNTKIEFVVQRAGKRVELITTKRDAPALSLFPALDREWVLWMPRGYYDTSAIGDRKYLGWHRNRLVPTESTDYFTFDNFEKELRKPIELDRLLQTADLGVFEPAVGEPAVRQPEQIVAEDRLPRVEIVGPARPPFEPLVAAGGALPFRVRATTEDGVAGRGLISALRVLVDSGKVTELSFNPPVAAVDREVTVNVNPGIHKVSVVAVNTLAKERTHVFDVLAPEPPKPVEETPPRLVVLAIGADSFGVGDSSAPRIPFAKEDARDVGAFLGAPGGTSRFQRVDVRPILGADATAERILAAFKTLTDEREQGELGQGDAVFVTIDSHFLTLGKEATILGTDSTLGKAPTSSISTTVITETLGQLADYGCTVMLMLDTLHEKRPAPPQTNRGLNEWARTLYRRNVIAMLSSIHGPSQSVVSRGHGAFALGILDSLNVQGRARLTSEADRPLTLFDFQDRVARNVQGVTNRQQHARCYIPDAIASQTAIFDPPTRSQPRRLRAATE